MTADADKSVRCSVSGCSCPSFKPGSAELRSCDVCRHSWVLHVMQKLRPPCSSGDPVEVALPGPVFELSSLVLYGAQAVPVQLKILLDRLYSVLTPEQVRHILHSLGWSLGDYIRGYMLQQPGGSTLERWLMVTPEEEQLVFQQFLRFGETRPIVQQMAPVIGSAPTCCRSSNNVGAAPLAGFCCFMKEPPADSHVPAQHMQSSSGGRSLLRPFHFPSSALCCFAPSSEDLAPPTQLTTNQPDGGRGQGGAKGRGKMEPSGASPWQRPHNNPDLQAQRGMAALRSSSSAVPSFMSHSSPSLLSAAPPKPLPLPSPHPPPASICSFSSPAGRKGRVFCGVCGKSFYDKGTLKIHYNAVHLKIKHRCTVSGCSMVFSSLRSRNRHSANPNPRLHTARDTHVTHAHTHHTGWQQDDAPRLPQQGGQDRTPPQGLQAAATAASSLPSSPPVPPLEGVTRTSQATPPPLPASITRQLVSTGQQRESCDIIVPKKKPRKSSTPLKIAREKEEE